MTAKSMPAATKHLAIVAVIAISIPLSFAHDEDDAREFFPPANQGAFEGGPTGTFADAGINNVVQEDEQHEEVKFNFPTNGPPSPLFGAKSFEQQMLRLEEFGTKPMPTTFAAGDTPFPQPMDPQSGPEGGDLDDYLQEDIFPAPTRLANDIDSNPWRAAIEGFLGRSLDSPPAEGRPPGEIWSHQRWDEFPPEVYFTTATAEAKDNRGIRDDLQLHGYSAGEFAPGGLYHNTVGRPADVPQYNGTTEGIEVRFHPNLPIQEPETLWTFDGTFPPKLLMVRYSEVTLMRHYNMVPIDPAANMGFGLHTLTTHEHNGHTPAESDGFTQAFFFPGQYYDYRWPIALAGFDTVNTSSSDPKAATPCEIGETIRVQGVVKLCADGTIQIPGDYRETMSTHWFHDHMLDFTAPNVYKGSATMMNYYSAIDRGNEGLEDGVNLRLPSGTALDWGNRDYDVNLMIADKAWDEDGQLWFNIFNLDGFMGDVILTNFLYNPYFEVRARRYRFRILNASVARYFAIALITESGKPVTFHMIANDGNIMEHTVAFDGSNGTQKGVLPTLGIAERYDIVVDFSQFEPGDKLYLVNLLEHRDGRGPKELIDLEEVVSGEYQASNLGHHWSGGDPTVGKFLEFRVKSYSEIDLSMDPAEYVPGGKTMIPLPWPTDAELQNARHRTFEFGRSSGTDNAPWTIETDDGRAFGMDPRRLSAAPNRGELSVEGLGHVEIWNIKNGGGGWSHPVHVHFEEGIILERDGRPPPEWEKWARKDVYRIGRMDDSGDNVEMAIRLREFSGTYMEHCHNTQHEDHAMLLRWDVENPGQFTIMPTPMPTWDGVGYVETIALATFRTGDGIGPSGGFEGGGGDNGGGDSGGDNEEEAADELEINRAKYRSDKQKWIVEGASSVPGPGNTITVHLGPTLGGAVIGTVNVGSSGAWELRVKKTGIVPDATETVSIESSKGGQLLAVPIRIQ